MTTITPNQWIKMALFATVIAVLLVRNLQTIRRPEAQLAPPSALSTEEGGKLFTPAPVTRDSLSTYSEARNGQHLNPAIMEILDSLSRTERGQASIRQMLAENPALAPQLYPYLQYLD